MIIPYAYEYFDNQQNKYDSYFKNNKLIFDQKPINDLENWTFKLFDQDKIILFGEICNIGSYNPINNTWYWAWSLPLVTKSENNLARKLINYAFDIEFHHESTIENMVNTIFKAELLSSKLFLENSEIEIEKFIAITMYITKSDYFFVEQIKVNNNLICEKYFLLRNIQFP